MEKVPVHRESTEKNILTSDSAGLGPVSEKSKQTLKLTMDRTQAILGSSFIYALGVPPPEVHNILITRHTNVLAVGSSKISKGEQQIQSISFFSVIHLQDILNTVRVPTSHNYKLQISLEFLICKHFLTFVSSPSGKCLLVSFLNN